MSERFYVATCTGFLQASRGSTRNKEGISASVLDRGRLHREVALYRSEDFNGYSHDAATREAVARAERHAAMMNAGEQIDPVLLRGRSHGTLYAYEHCGCRCADCRRWRRDRARRERAER